MPALIALCIKAYPEVVQLYREKLEENEPMTSGKFLEFLLENLQNPKGKTINVPVDNEQDKLLIQEQTLQIEKLIQEKLDLDERNIQLESQLKEAYNDLNDIQRSLAESEGRDVNTRLEENQVIITLEPYVKFFVDKVLEAYAKKNKPTTAGLMLLNLFWNYIYRGAGDYLPVLFDTSYVKDVLEKFKREQKLRMEAAADESK
jgi:hypothetical protein